MDKKIVVCQGTNIYKKGENEIVHPFIGHNDNKVSTFMEE
jgi:hypothetical protein